MIKPHIFICGFTQPLHQIIIRLYNHAVRFNNRKWKQHFCLFPFLFRHISSVSNKSSMSSTIKSSFTISREIINEVFTSSFVSLVRLSSLQILLRRMRSSLLNFPIPFTTLVPPFPLLLFLLLQRFPIFRRYNDTM